MPTTAVLGGGLSGLSAAFYLSRRLPANHKIVLLEKSARFGGWIQTRHNDSGITFETGPRSIRPVGLSGALTLDLVRSSTTTSSLIDVRAQIDQLGLAPELITVPKSHPAAKNRFIYYNGRFNKAPNRFATAVSASMSSTSPFSGLLPMIMKEPFKRKRESEEDESIHAFISRRFSSAFADNVLSALLHGIYAGDISQLSLQAVFPSLNRLEKTYGSVVLGMMRGGSKMPAHEAKLKAEIDKRIPEIASMMKDASIYSLRGGLELLPQTLIQYLRRHQNVELRHGCGLEELRYQSKSFDLQTTNGDLKVDHVVSALPGAALSTIVPLPLLSSNPSVTVGVVNLAFPKPFKLKMQGFGYLIPKSVPLEQNPHRALGVIFDSETFPDDGPTRITVMLGGHFWANGSIPSKSELEKAALETVQLHGLVPTSVQPVLVEGHVQRDCIPQYTVGHPGRMRKLHEQLLDKYDGRLSVIGSSYTGVGLNDCVRNSYETASLVADTGVATGLESFIGK